MNLRTAFLILVALAAALPSPDAFASFSGSPGAIVWAFADGRMPPTQAHPTAIFSSSGGQLTFPDISNQQSDDYAPSVSADGRQIVYVRYVFGASGGYSLVVMDAEGGNERTLWTQNKRISTVAWSRDGSRIVFNVIDLSSGGLWIINSDGTGLAQLWGSSSQEQTTFDPEWSPGAPDTIAFRCRFRPLASSVVGQSLRDDLCLLDPNTGAFHQLPIDWPAAATTARFVISHPHWTPDGQKLIFTMQYAHPEEISFHSPNGVVGTVGGYTRREVFTVRRDGSGVTELTQSPYIVINSFPYVIAKTEFWDAVMSPDGQSIATIGEHFFVAPENTFLGITLLTAKGQESTILKTIRVSPGPKDLDWQAFPNALTFNLHDGLKPAGGPHPLKGLKLELLQLNETVVDDHPVNTIGGTYVFRQAPPAGQYLMRATLVDNDVRPGAVPSFDIRHSEKATEPVWFEWSVTTAGSGTFDACFCEENPTLVGYTTDLPSDVGDRLDDMANIYFRLRQYVDWVKDKFQPDTGPTVNVYTFVPANGSDFEADDAAYQSPNRIAMGTVVSDFSERDGVIGVNPLDPTPDGAIADDGPQNDEWHEFTHHLFYTFIYTGAGTNPDGSPLCRNDAINHRGFNNPDTCDSMSEGFAMFLPTLAAQDIEGKTTADYGNWGLNFDDFKYKPWGHRRDHRFVYETTAEDTAVAGLLWDLTDSTSDTEATQIIGANGLHRDVTFTDQTSMSLKDLWDQLKATHPPTVYALRQMFGSPNGLTIDLDGDGLRDIDALDQVFLMHGFYPVDGDETRTLIHQTYHYDVAYAQRINPISARNSAVGLTSHRVYNDGGGLAAVLIPRRRTPADPNAVIRLNVVDGGGAPLSGAQYRLSILEQGAGAGTTTGAGLYGGLEARLAIQSPGGHSRTVSRSLASGGGVLMHLELPPYFNYLLPEGAALPPCNASTDQTVQVGLSAVANGNASSTETHTFTNCEYQQAIEAAGSNASLTYTMTVPNATTPTATVTAVADELSTFIGWSGPNAAECASGQVVMDADKSCIATFELRLFGLTVNKSGTGSGRVTGAGSYAPGTRVEVTAIYDPGSSFTGWSGPNGAECATGVVTMTADKSCTAGFDLITYTLAIAKGGPGTGTVTGAGTYGYGQTATVTAVANPGYEVGPWTGTNGAECATGSVVMTQNKSCTANFLNDLNPPTGSVIINNGAAATNVKTVVLTLTCADPAGCSQMQFSNTGSNGWSKLQPFATTASWPLSNGDGVKTVYMRLQDGVGNLSSTPLSDQIVLDATLPSGTVVVNANAAYGRSAAATLTLTCTDSGSGCAQMQFSNDGSTWSALEAFSTSKAWTLTAGDGIKTVSARYTDAAGNLSLAKTDQITIDTAIPTGTVALAGGGTIAKSIVVTLSLSCVDSGASGCSQMQFSNEGGSWSAPQPYATSTSWTLASGDGAKSLSARFVDGAGNVSSAASAVVIVDSTSPAGSILINDGAAATTSRSVTLTLTCSDAGTGCSQMQFSDSGTSGWSKLQPFAPSAAYTLPNGKGTKTVYVRLTDAVGNVSGNFADSIVVQ